MRISWPCLLVAACGNPSGPATPPDVQLETIGVAPDGRGFVRVDSGKPYSPWGLNYDHDADSRLLEDYWVDQWPTVQEDFEEMRSLGANVVRIHLQLPRFMTAADEVDTAALDRLAQLVALAESTGLYLDLTGLGCYRAEDVPGWYDALDEDARWAVQARFWSAIAERVGSSPAIFAYDLMNEPVVPGEATDTWLPGEPLGGFHYVQHITRDPAGRPWPEIMRAWIETLTAAIREHDPDHLVTVGWLPFASHAQLADAVDHVSVHVYPKAGEIDASLQLLAALGDNRPVVVEETYHLESGIDELRTFIVDARAQDLAAGWMGFYWGTPPSQLDDGDIGDALQAEWLALFEELAPS